MLREEPRERAFPNHTVARGGGELTKQGTKLGFCFRKNRSRTAIGLDVARSHKKNLNSKDFSEPSEDHREKNRVSEGLAIKSTKSVFTSQGGWEECGAGKEGKAG